MSEAAEMVHPQELTVTFEQDADGSGPAPSSSRETEGTVFGERSKAAFEIALERAYIDIPPVLASTLWSPSDGQSLPSSPLDRRPPVPGCIARAVASDLFEYVSKNFEDFVRRTRLSEQSFDEVTQDIGWVIKFNAREPYFYTDSVTQKMMLRCETSIWASVSYKNSSRSLIPDLRTKFEALVPAKSLSYEDATMTQVPQGFGYTAYPPPPDQFEPLIEMVVDELLSKSEEVQTFLWSANTEVPQESRSHVLTTGVTYYPLEDVTRTESTYRGYHLHNGFAALARSVKVVLDAKPKPDGGFYWYYHDIKKYTGVLEPIISWNPIRRGPSEEETAEEETHIDVEADALTLVGEDTNFGDEDETITLVGLDLE